MIPARRWCGWLERLTGIVDALAGSVVAHDNQIDALIRIAEAHKREMAEFRKAMVETERPWQAYLKALPRQ